MTGVHRSYRFHLRRLRAAAERSHIVYGETPVLLKKSTIEPSVGHLRYAPVCSIFRRLEIDGGRPVVAGIFFVETRRACGCFGRVDALWVHLGCCQRVLFACTSIAYSDVERVTSDNLMHMW
jgi:hypothetical protein